MDNLLDNLKCSYLKTNTIFKVIVIVTDKRIIKVKKIDVNHNGETVEKILDQLPFDDCRLLLPTGKLDDTEREIIDGDYVTYGNVTGLIKYDNNNAQWMMVDNDNITYKLADFDSKRLHVTGNKYGNINQVY